MKFIQICFAGLIVLLLLGGCGAGPAQPISAINSQKTTATIAAPTGMTPKNLPRPTITPFPPLTHQETTVEPSTSATEPVITPLPVITHLPSITPIPSLTPIPTMETKPTSSGPPKPLQCRLYSTSPELGEAMRPSKDFQGIWRLFNVGTLPWQDDDIALFFLSGYKFQSSKYQEDFIPYIVNPKDQLNLHVPMKSPKEPGLYSAIWGLRSKTTKQFFCVFTIFIEVKVK